MCDGLWQCCMPKVLLPTGKGRDVLHTGKCKTGGPSTSTLKLTASPVCWVPAALPWAGGCGPLQAPWSWRRLSAWGRLLRGARALRPGLAAFVVAACGVPLSAFAPSHSRLARCCWPMLHWDSCHTAGGSVSWKSCGTWPHCSGQWDSFNTLPHCRGNQQWGSFTTLLHYRGRGQAVFVSTLPHCTGWWAVGLPHYTATL